MNSFTRDASGSLKNFHKGVEARVREIGGNTVGLGMLQQQISVYEQILKDLAFSTKDAINTRQKDVNREFVPVIARQMNDAYNTCTAEYGKSYVRLCFPLPCLSRFIGLCLQIFKIDNSCFVRLQLPQCTQYALVFPSWTFPNSLAAHTSRRLGSSKSLLMSNLKFRPRLLRPHEMRHEFPCRPCTPHDVPKFRRPCPIPSYQSGQRGRGIYGRQDG